MLKRYALPWFKADIGEMTSLEVWKAIGFQGDLKIQKPDERIFQLTIEELGVKAEDCWYIDDREGNLEAAKKGADVFSKEVSKIYQLNNIV